MADKGTKKKPAKAKAQAQESGVLASLPATRPARLSRHSRTEATATRSTSATKAKGKPKAKKAKTKAKAAPVKATAVATSKPKAEATSAPPVAAVPRPRPTPVRAGSHKLADSAQRSAGARVPTPPKAPSGTELVTTVVQAAGELAQVGLTVTGQILKRAVQKLPKP